MTKTIALLTLVLFVTLPASASEPSGLVVSAVQGDVYVTVRGKLSRARAAMLIELPATIQTGANSSLELRQGVTAISVAAGTQLELPAPSERGAPIERVVQPNGNAFYSVGKRPTKKFRVETPYLVAVVKGTQFNVAVENDNATVALFEGRLEVRAADESDVVQLEAGEIAIRQGSDTHIQVLRAGSDVQLGRSDLLPADGSVSSSIPAASALLLAEHANDVPGDERNSVSSVELTETAAGSGGTELLASAQTDLSADSAKVSLDLAGSSADVGAAASIDIGAGSVDVGVGLTVDLSSATVDAGASAAVDLGVTRIDASASTLIDLGVGSADVGASATVGLGATSADVGASASVDLGTSSSVDVGASAAVDLGSSSVDIGASTSVDLGASSLDAGASTSVDLGAASIDVGATTSVDLGAGAVETSITVGGVEIDAGVDLGGITTGATSTPSPSNGGGVLDGLRGLLGRP